MAPLQRLKTKYDLLQNGSIKRNITKIELLIELRKKGVDTTSRRFFKDELIGLSTNNNIPVYTIDTRKENGWAGTPKGMLQILYERGFINAALVNTARSTRYSKLGKKNDFEKDTGKIMDECKQYSLTHLFSKCSDFTNEITDLEHLCVELSTLHHNITSSVLFTPKFHCEFCKGEELYDGLQT